MQAKKLLDNKSDNYPYLHYGNKNGLQIDLLTEKATLYNAFPLYMYYSATEPEIQEQKNHLHLVDGSTLNWCASCSNGCFLSNAYDVYDLLFSTGRKRLLDIELLNHSYKLSLLDKLFACQMDNRERLLSTFNRKAVAYLEATKRNAHDSLSGISGIKHYGKGIPSYLSLFVERHNEDLVWFESEMRHVLPAVGGIGVIDLRED